MSIKCCIFRVYGEYEIKAPGTKYHHLNPSIYFEEKATRSFNARYFYWFVEFLYMIHYDVLSHLFDSLQKHGTNTHI